MVENPTQVDAETTVTPVTTPVTPAGFKLVPIDPRPAIADTPFTHALRADMERLHLNARGLGRRLGISQQAIQKWLREGAPPLFRVPELRDVLGPGEVSSMTLEDIVQPGGKKSRAINQRPTHYDPPLPIIGAATALTGMGATRTPAAQLRKRSAEAIEEFARNLPLPLAAHTAHEDSRLDYASPSLLLACKVRLAGEPITSVANPVMELLAAHKGSALDPRTVLAIIAESDDYTALSGRSVKLARVLGVEVWLCRTGAELADKVREAEGYEADELDENG